MQHTSRMILVPEVKYNALASQQQQMIPPTVVQMAELDGQMRDIVNNNQYGTVDEKLALYQQTLRRYTMMRDNETGRSILARPQPRIEQQQLQQPPLGADQQPQPQPPPTFPVNAILNSLPRTLTNKAQLLLEHLRSNPAKFQLSDKNELVLDGNKQAGSNFIDLIHEVVRPRKIRNLAGSKAFAQSLAESNVPLEALGGGVERLGLLRAPSPQADVADDEAGSSVEDWERTATAGQDSSASRFGTPSSGGRGGGLLGVPKQRGTRTFFNTSRGSPRSPLYNSTPTRARGKRARKNRSKDDGFY